MILGLERLAKHIYFLSAWFVHQQQWLPAGWNGNTAWDTSTLVGWQQISLIIESKTLYDCKRLHAAQKECVGSQCIFWVLEEEFWCLTRTDFRTLYGVDRLCMLHTDIMYFQHRRQLLGLQTEISCLTNTDFSILYGGLKLCVQHRHHCTSLAARNWCWGSLGSLGKQSFSGVLQLRKPLYHALKDLNHSRGVLG